MSENRGVLVIDTGKELREFPGVLFGATLEPDSVRDKGFGEVVFNTSMTGYQEILTDPSYYGQIVCMTYPHIGNTGVNKEDIESRAVWCAGFVVGEYSESPSNWRSEQTLNEYLIENNIPGIQKINTRALVRAIRSEGAMRGVILKESEKHRAKELLNGLPAFENRDLIKEVSTPQKYYFKGTGESNRFPKSKDSANSKNSKDYRVAVVDFGTKTNLLRMLEERGCSLEVFPAETSASEILETQPDGIFLSNGPGDPSAAPYAVRTVKELLGKKPIFGVCMGHQILAQSLGARTFKLKFGHRGGNQPVQDQETTRVEISSHNHGYAVELDSLPKNVKASYINLNDRTVEGIIASEHRAYSVQFHPEASPGPHDSWKSFDAFLDSMRELKTR